MIKDFLYDRGPEPTRRIDTEPTANQSILQPYEPFAPLQIAPVAVLGNGNLRMQRRFVDTALHLPRRPLPKARGARRTRSIALPRRAHRRRFHGRSGRRQAVLGIHRHGRPEGQSAAALQRRTLPQAEDPDGHPRRFRRRRQRQALRDDQRRLLVGGQLAEPAHHGRRREIDRESDRGTQRADGVPRARRLRTDERRQPPEPLDLLPAQPRRQALRLPLGARQRRTHPHLHVRAPDLELPRRRAVDAARSRRRRSDAGV